MAQSPAPRPAFDAFEVATIKPTSPDSRAGRYIRMQSGHQFLALNYTVRGLIGAAYNLPPRIVSGGPAWSESDTWEIRAVTPGDVQPTTDEQMRMLRKLLADRFQFTFHRESKDLPVYALTVMRSGPKLTESTDPPETQPQLINTVYPEAEGGVHIGLPARNATMGQFTAMLQKIMDRPVVDRTGLSGRYDFTLEWRPDQTFFDGNLQPSPNSAFPDFYAALQQLGLRIENMRAPVEVVVIDSVEHPSAN